MKTTFCFLIGLLLAFAQSTRGLAGSPFEIALAKREPVITIFIKESENRYEINNCKHDKATVEKKLQYDLQTFGPDIPVALVVSEDTKISELQQWLAFCKTHGTTSVRVYVSDRIDWKANPQFKSALWFDPQLGADPFFRDPH